MARLFLLFIMSLIALSQSALSQKRTARNVNMIELERKLVVPGWASINSNYRSSNASRNSNTPDATCDTILLTRQSQIDSFKILYPGCTSVAILEINGQGASPAITKLDSLHEITSVTQKLKITHTSITSLSALTSLTSIGDTLELEYNFLQTSIGLNNLTQLGNVIISKLPALTTLAGLSNGMTSIGGVLIDSTGLTSLTGLESVKKINGYLDLRFSPIINLNSISNLDTINGYLRLERLSSFTSIGLNNLKYVFGFLFAGLDNLTSLSGLSNNLQTTNLGTIWMINTGITSLSGLNNVTGCSNFYFWINPNLTTLNGFNQVAGDVPGGFSLWANDALTDISALSNITSTSNGDLDFHGNNQLSNLTGLGNIVTIGRRLRVYENPLITSLSFLNNSLVIQDNNTEGIQIENNPQLSVCSFDPVCNYLNNGGFGVVQNNAPGCSSISEIQAGCGSACTTGVLKTWTGNNSTNWNDPDNWSPAGVPGTCDKIYIPNGVPDNPVANTHLSIGGLIIESGNSLDMNGFNLVCKDTLHIDDGDISNANSIQFNTVNNPYLFDASIQSNTAITFNKYVGSLYFAYNTFIGNVILIDSIGRAGVAEISSNQFNNDLTIFGASQMPGAHTIISGSGDDYISGSFTIAYTSVANLIIGTGGTLHIAGDLNLNTNVNPALINLNAVNFNGGSNSHIRQFGTVPVSFNNLYTDKFSKAQLIIPEQPIYLRGVACMSGGLIKTTPSTLLIAEDNAAINCHSSESWVWGPIRKIGNDQFTFVVGDSLKKAILTMATAPAQVTDAFTAQYFRTNPSAAGYDTAQHVSSLTTVSGKEYWMFTRDNGNSNVRINLQYDSTRSQKISSIYSLRASQWNGSQWINNGALSVTGNLHEAYVTSQDVLSSFGPVTLGYVIPPRIPVITITKMDSVACRGGSFKVHFTVDTLMFPTNTFAVQLSDSSGSFANPILLGLKSNAVSSDSITVFIPSNTILSSDYRVRVTGTAPPDTSVNTKPLAVRTVPSLNFTIEGPAIGCVGTLYKYYPSQREDGASYNWLVTGGTFTTNQDTAYVTWNTAGTGTITLRALNACGNGPSANRNITVNPPIPSAAPVLTNTGRWLHASALPVNASGYRWFRNDTLITGAVNASYYASAAGTYTVRFYSTCGDGPVSNSISFAAASIPQTITFNTIPDKVFGDAPFTVDATASSGLPLNLQIISGPGNLTAGVYTITTTGTVTIRATQTGDNVYDTTAPVTRTFTISKASQTISFNTIPDFIFGVSASPFQLNASASSGLAVNYNLSGSAASLAGNIVTVTGLGTVSITASQPGDTNYLPATSVIRNFCVRVNDLTNISGAPFVCPGQTATYTINNVPGLTYSWRLSNGTTYASATNTAAITWNTAGTYTLIVSATGPCGTPTSNDSLVVNVISPVTPAAVTGMIPADGSAGLALPLTLSWLPASNALTYDLYVWDSTTAQPSQPYAANITGISYTLAKNVLPYNKTYNWRIVSKNACLQTNGPVQRFRLRALPDLSVTQVLAPAAANSGQTITINWTVKNNGPGNTATNQSWTDAVFLSFDTLPTFINPTTNGFAWSAFDFPIRPLLIGTKPNATALDSGQQYSNSINFTLPLNYAQPLYAYVITDYPAGNNSPLQMTYANDTARAATPILVTLSPTPDLRVDTVFTPASTFSGSTVTVAYKVKNYGVLTPAGTGWTDRFYISPSPLFNSNNAIPLNAPKPNGTYYPNALLAGVANNQQLLADSSVTRNTEVVIPNYLSGTWFIHVITNATGSLYEGALANNNINNSVVQVFLTPTPQLTINSLTVPLTTMSVTQPVGINWNVLNVGFRDNIEKNKGHYFVARPCPQGIVYIDSLGHGGSYWVDRVYLSSDANGLNVNIALLLGEVPKGVLNGGSNSPDYLLPGSLCGGATPGNVNTVNVLSPNSNHPNNLNFTVPANLQPGNYYVYVYTNPAKTVFEFPDTPSIRRSALPITIQRPDLTVPSVIVPAATTGAQTFTITYTVQNNGPGTVFNAQRKDRIFVSTSPVFDGSAVLVKTETFTSTLNVNAPQQFSTNYTFPPGTSGTRYIYVQTNFDSSFTEINYANNISAAAATTVSTAVPADLMITGFQMLDTVSLPGNLYFRYAIANNGAATASGLCTDSIFIGCNPVYSNSSASFIGTRSVNRVINAGSAVADSFTINLNQYTYNINPCFPIVNNSPVYFFIKVNANNTIYEGSNTANNLAGSGIKTILNKHVDHIVTTVSGADTTTAGRPYLTKWTVKNNGLNPGGIFYVQWFDAIYFSPDSVFNANAKPASNFFSNSTLNNNETYSESLSATTPNIPTGDYYVHVVTNNNNGIRGEINRANNSNVIRTAGGAAKKIHVIQPPLPDLTDTIIQTPASVAIGQPLKVTYRINNIGAGVTFPNTWTNEFWLSADFVLGNAGDIWLGSVNRSGALQPGTFYTDSLTMQIPMNVTGGNYILIAVANAGRAVIESNDTNNLTFQPITIVVPAASDLIVQSIAVPDTVLLGYTIDTAKWIVQNSSSNAAAGVSADGIYLSKNTALDSADVLIGIKNKFINMGPLATDTIRLQPMVNNVTEGIYHVLVKTDLLNNIVETDKNNNVTAAAKTVYVKVKELALGVEESNTLQTIGRYYKLRIPDSLRGSTILLTLKTGDSLTMRNEMYVGGSYVPSPAQFTYRFETPNYGNQQILMSDVTDSVYYIFIRCVSPNPVLQNITVKAVKLPFAIVNINAASGGNGGNVTVKITGSLFTGNMQATLSRPGTTITAQQVYFINSTTVFATFPLQARPLGVYDITLTKPDASVAVLAGAFSVVSPNNGGLVTGGGVNTGPTGSGTDPGCDPGADAGLNSQLVVQLVYPEKVFSGWPFTIQLNFSNPTNMDIPVQTRVLYNDRNVPMSLTQAGLANGSSTLYLQLTEPGGPPGIIRAGGSGSIIIYSKAPLSTPGHTIVNLNLK